MAFSLGLASILETYEEEVQKREKALEKRAEASEKAIGNHGGVDSNGAALPKTLDNEHEKRSLKSTLSADDLIKVFAEVVKANASWLSLVIEDAVEFARCNQPRSDDVVLRVPDPEKWKAKPKQADAASSFAQAWQSLKNRGWKADTPTAGDNAGKTRYEFEGKHVRIRLCLSYERRCAELTTRPFSIPRLLRC
jgi:hypothetical protein